MKRSSIGRLAFAAVFSFSSPTLAEDFKVGDLVVSKPVARATAPSAKNGAGYVVIENNGTSPDRLIGGSADFAGKVMIHSSELVDGIMIMRSIEGGLEIPAGGKVMLKPGGNHIMFMKLQEQLVEGETRNATLNFKNAGELDVKFTVKSIAETMKMKHKHGDH